MRKVIILASLMLWSVVINAQSCVNISTSGFTSCEKTIVEFNAEFSEPVNVTWVFSQNTSGATFEESGTTTYSTNVNQGINILRVNSGSREGYFTVKAIVGNSLTVGSCSASRNVNICKFDNKKLKWLQKYYNRNK